MSSAIWTWWHICTLFVYAVCATFASVHALLRKRDPRAAFGWIGVCWLLPLAGAALYALFGINRVETRGRRLKGLSEVRRAKAAPSHDERLPLTQLQRLGGAISGMPLTIGNAVQPLRNGEEAYPAMLEAISAATKSIWLASYILDVQGWCHRFVDALVDAHKRDVEVRVLVDGFGEYYSLPRPVSLLRSYGLRAERFLPPRIFPPSLSLNLRNHRKLLVVDGELAFAGGMNIGNRHLIGYHGHPMQDLHFRLVGPVVGQLATTFGRDWFFATSEQLPAINTPPPAGSARCRVISDGPDEDIDKLLLLLISAIAAAHRRVCIMTPYFLPPRELATTLQAAVLRGVEVDVLLPAHSNLFFVDWASRHGLVELLEYGVRIWLSPPPFTHSKLFLVDELYSLVGSANLDPRSLRLNFEIGVEVFDEMLCTNLTRLFDHARTRAVQMSTAGLLSQSLPVRLRNSIFWLFSPYL